LQYRAAAWAGLATQLFWGLIRVLIFTAFYRSNTDSQPLALPDTITYLWLTQATFALTFLRIDTDVQGMIRTGTVAYEMLRPVDLYFYWFSRAVAARIVPTLLRAMPLALIAVPYLGMGLPASFGAGVAFLVSMIGAVCVASACTVLMTISLLYTISGEGVVRIAPTLAMIFSGMLVPLPLLPKWAQTLCEILPFSGLLDYPCRLYIGHIPAPQAILVFAHQILWTALLILVGRLFLARATRRLVVQGG
jgi:ABC-2 type transport system permease protein